MAQSSDYSSPEAEEEESDACSSSASSSSSSSSSSVSVSPPREPFPKVPEAALRAIRRHQIELRQLKREKTEEDSGRSTPADAEEAVAPGDLPPQAVLHGKKERASSRASSSSSRSSASRASGHRIKQEMEAIYEGLPETVSSATDQPPLSVPWRPVPVADFVPDPCPVRRYESQLLQTVRTRQVTIVEGECGGGKSTHVPRLLVEGGVVRPGQALLSVQPYHVACVRLADWGAHDPILSRVPGGVYCDTEFSPTVPEDAAVMFCSAVQVLQRLKSDPTLAGVGCVIVDELQEGQLYQDVLLSVLRSLLVKSRLKAKLILMGTPGSVEAKDWLGLPSGLPESLAIPTKTLEPKEFTLEDAVQWTSFDAAELLQFEGRPVPALDAAEVTAAQAACGPAYAVATVRSALLIEKTSLPTELLRDLVFLLHGTRFPGAIVVFLPDATTIDQLSDSLLLHPVGAELLLCPLHPLTSPSQLRCALYERTQVRKVILTSPRLCEAVINVPDVSFVINAVGDPVGDGHINPAARRASHAGRACRGVVVHLHRRGAPLPPATADSAAEVGPDLQAAALYLLLGADHTAVGPQPAPGHGLASLKRKVLAALKRAGTNPATKRKLGAAIDDLRTACLLDSDGRVTAYGQRIAALLPLRPSLGRLVLCGALLRVILPAVAMAVSWMAQETLGRLREPEASAPDQGPAGPEDLLASLRLYASLWTMDGGPEDASLGRPAPEALLCIHNAVMRITQQLQALGATYDPVLGQQQLLYAAEAQSDAALVLRAALCAAWPACVAYVAPAPDGEQPSQAADSQGGSAVDPRPGPRGSWVLRTALPCAPGEDPTVASTPLPGQLVLLTADDVHYDQNLKFGPWQAETAASEEALLTMLETHSLLRPSLDALQDEGALRPVDEGVVDRICEACDEDFDLHDVRAIQAKDSPSELAAPASTTPSAEADAPTAAAPEPAAPPADGDRAGEAERPKRPMPEDEPELPAPKRHSAEGWQCQNVNCLAVNAAHRVECQQCGSHYWDWPCVGCGAMNEVRRTTCQTCRLTRTDDQDQIATQLLKRSPNFNLMATQYYVKVLSHWLRHEAKEKGLSFGEDGFVPVGEVLAHKVFHGITLASLKAIVHRDEKGRLTIAFDEATQEWRIRANYGHSLSVPLLRLDPVSPEEADYLPLAHLTTRSCLPQIRSGGLRTMERQYIHFAVEQPGHHFPGAPDKANVIIYIDVAKCVQDKVPLFHCGAVLCVSPGLAGAIPPAYFRAVLDRASRRRLR